MVRYKCCPISILILCMGVLQSNRLCIDQTSNHTHNLKLPIYRKQATDEYKRVIYFVCMPVCANVCVTSKKQAHYKTN